MLNYDNTGVTVELGEIVSSGVNIWDFDYPVPRSEIQYNGKTCKVDFDKATFEQKVIDHYRFRQIGFETVGRFLHYFRSRIKEIMPYYVQVYEFDAKFRNIEDPLESYNLMETFQQEQAGTGKVTGTSSDTASTEQDSSLTANESKTSEQDSTRKFSNTPQGSISNLDSYLTEANVEHGDGSEDANRSETSSGNVSSSATGSSEQSSEGSETLSHTLTRRGNIGVQPLGGEVQNIRSAFINIDMQIIEDLKDLFLQVY